MVRNIVVLHDILLAVNWIYISDFGLDWKEVNVQTDRHKFAAY